MKKSDTYSQINRNTTINGTHRKDQRVHPVSPDILIRQIWRPDRETNGAKVIELVSKDTGNENLNFNQASNYVNHDRFLVESPNNNYNVNSKARERKRLANRNRNQLLYPHPDLGTEERYIGDLIEDNVRLNQTNCFTIIKNSCTEESDSSSDNSDVEFINCNDIFCNNKQYECNKHDRSYEEGHVTCNADVDGKKRTIWIYSFQDKHHFTENYFKYSSSEYSSSTSTENCERPVKDTNVARVPTPIPGMYVPRLNLSLPPALPTVTEVTEPKHCSNKFLKSECNIKKHVNGWFINVSPETKEPLNNDHETLNKDNGIDWMCLSPRNKQNRWRITNHERSQIRDNLPMAREASPIGENNSHNMICNRQCVKTEIIQNTPVNNLGRSTENNIGDQIHLVKNISLEDVNEIEDRGDQWKNLNLKKPTIRISPKAKIKTATDPIELLDSNNWIIEEKLPDLENKEDIEDLSRKLWAKNMVLLKPSQWSEFFPMSDSVPSLHLSLETVIEEMPWYRRILGCFKCFK